MKTYLISLGIALVIGGFIGWSIKPEKDCPEPNTLIEYRFITQTDTLVKPIFKTIVKKDTIKYRDTLFIHEETNYIAEVDTTYQDSLLKAKVQYVSDIPLSPKSYFNLDFKVREKIITNTVIQEKRVYAGSKYFLDGGIKMRLTDNVEPIYYGGGGVYLVDNSWLEIPVGLQAQYIEKNFDWYLGAEARIKFGDR